MCNDRLEFWGGLSGTPRPISDVEIAFTKIWFIGRTYGAALERLGRPADWTASGLYYAAAEAITDWRMGSCVACSHLDLVNLLQEAVPDVRTARSLASKYMHFHARNEVPIFDSITARGLTKEHHRLGACCREQVECTGRHDKEFADFLAKFRCFQNSLKQENRENLQHDNLRQIDDYLQRAGRL